MKLYRVKAWESKATYGADGSVSDGFGTREAAERFANSMAQAGRIVRAEIVSYEVPDSVPDEVIRWAVRATENHATEVRDALTKYLQSHSEQDARRLRETLVAMSEGFDTSAHDGSTHGARREAAREALASWAE